MVHQAAIPPTFGVESIFEGGPPRRLTALARLPSPIAPNATVRAVLTFGIAWIPLAVLVAIDIVLGRPSVLYSFVEDIGVHARYAIAAPLLVLGHVVCARRLGRIAYHFQVSGLLGEDDQRRVREALEATRRRVHSLWAEAIVILLVYSQVAVIVMLEPQILRQAAWQVAPDAGGLSPAGWWHGVVSVPLLLALLLGWLWRIANWAWFLREVSQMNLRLVSAHPDQAGGLGFLSQSVRAFCIVGMGLGAIVAGIRGACCCQRRVENGWPAGRRAVDRIGHVGAPGCGRRREHDRGVVRRLAGCASADGRGAVALRAGPGRERARHGDPGVASAGHLGAAGGICRRDGQQADVQRLRAERGRPADAERLLAEQEVDQPVFGGIGEAHAVLFFRRL